MRAHCGDLDTTHRAVAVAGRHCSLQLLEELVVTTRPEPLLLPRVSALLSAWGTDGEQQTRAIIDSVKTAIDERIESFLASLEWGIELNLSEAEVVRHYGPCTGHVLLSELATDDRSRARWTSKGRDGILSPHRHELDDHMELLVLCSVLGTTPEACPLNATKPRARGHICLGELAIRYGAEQPSPPEPGEASRSLRSTTLGRNCAASGASASI